MSNDKNTVNRRDFLRRTAVAGAGAAALGRVPELRGAPIRTSAGHPTVITSHTNAAGREAMEAAWEILSGGGTALDAVERGANIIELDPDDHSVGYGGLPNADGVVQLDASIMDGRTYNAGSVASLENIVHASTVARLVMERTDHVMLVGPGALEFAKSFGIEETNLLTEEARQIWVRWRENLSDRDVWGLPAHLRDGDVEGAPVPMEYGGEEDYGTTNVLAVDANGDLAGITTTSGWSWKIPGRIGDSPIIGAGLYVDNQVGAAGATGRGEDVIKSCASYFIVMRMRDGRSPQEACEDAIEMIVDKYRAIGSDFIPGEKFVAINKDGEVGCSQMAGGVAHITVADGNGLEVVEGTGLYTRR